MQYMKLINFYEARRSKIIEEYIEVENMIRLLLVQSLMKKNYPRIMSLERELITMLSLIKLH